MTRADMRENIPAMTTTLFFLLTLFLSYATYFHRYDQPQAIFWDENYHLTSAQKYLNGTFFMQSHPPLGKLLIALGEKLINANDGDDDDFLDKDYTSSVPDGFSFTGYRFFPALFGWLTAPVLFLTFLAVTRRSLFAFLLSFLYIFDNALIVHSRGAMLEPPLVFFSALAVLGFILALQSQKNLRRLACASLLAGAAFGAAFATKLVALIFILLLPAGLIALRKSRAAQSTFILSGLLGFLVVSVVVWQIHFSLARNVNPSLENNGYFRTSEQYREILAEGATSSLLSFPVMIRDHVGYFGPANAGVPKLDLCKPDENGSPSFYWPLGARSINYRWNTPDGQSYQYLYLQSNPAGWFAGFLGVFFSVCLMLTHMFFGLPKWNMRMTLIASLLFLYIGYMAAMAKIDAVRVMYLYHYFTPLLLSFVLFAASTMELPRFFRWKLTERRRTLAYLILAGCVALSFFFFSPLTYYMPINDAAFRQRMIFPLWDLKCVNCERRDYLYIPKSSNNN